jgi:hypothetical protein
MFFSIQNWILWCSYKYRPACQCSANAKTENRVGIKKLRNYSLRGLSGDSLHRDTAPSLPSISPKSLDPRVFPWPGVFRCFAIQWLRPFLRVFHIDDQASLVAGRVDGFDTWTRWALETYAGAPRSSVCSSCGLWCFGLSEATSQTTGGA